jgi:hypothetical protein
MANRFFGPRIERIRGTGLTAKEKIAIYLCACALITPVIILTHSLHLRIFLLLLLAVKAVVFLRMKTAPPPCRSSTNPPPAIPQEIQKGSSVDSKKAGANTLNRPV